MSMLLWSVLWLAALQAPSVPRGEPAPGRAAIEGVVVRAGAAAGSRTGLPDARVELKPGNISVSTGADGAFIFRNVAPGRYTIAVTRDGYVVEEDRPRGITPVGRSVTVAAGQVLKSVILPMIPAPVITGTVFDPHGQRLAAALVRAYGREYTPWGPRLRIVKTGMTNDAGEFRLFGLRFGDYFVSAGYSERERAAAMGRARLTANVTKADDGYLTVFYDRAENIALARPVLLAPGVDPGMLNIELADSARFKIRGRVLPLANDTRIVLAPKGSELSDADYVTRPGAGGAITNDSVSPGS
jgi:hypothetical protein